MGRKTPLKHFYTSCLAIMFSTIPHNFGAMASEEARPKCRVAAMVVLTICFALNFFCLTVPSCWPWECQPWNQTLPHNSSAVGNEAETTVARATMILAVVLSAVPVFIISVFLRSPHSATRLEYFWISTCASLTSCCLMSMSFAFILDACPEPTPLPTGLIFLCSTFILVNVAIVLQWAIYQSNRGRGGYAPIAG